MFVLSTAPELARNLGTPVDQPRSFVTEDEHFHYRYISDGITDLDIYRDYCVAPDCVDTFTFCRPGDGHNPFLCDECIKRYTGEES